MMVVHNSQTEFFFLHPQHGLFFIVYLFFSNFLLYSSFFDSIRYFSLSSLVFTLSTHSNGLRPCGRTVPKKKKKKMKTMAHFIVPAWSFHYICRSFSIINLQWNLPFSHYSDSKIKFNHKLLSLHIYIELNQILQIKK